MNSCTELCFKMLRILFNHLRAGLSHGTSFMWALTWALRMQSVPLSCGNNYSWSFLAALKVLVQETKPSYLNLTQSSFSCHKMSLLSTLNLSKIFLNKQLREIFIHCNFSYFKSNHSPKFYNYCALHGGYRMAHIII